MKKKLVFGSMLAALLVLSLSVIGCKTDSDDPSPTKPGDDGGANIPTVYQNTTWTNPNGDKIVFTTNSVKVTPKDVAEKEFKCISIATSSMEGGSADEPTIRFETKSQYGNHISVKADGTKLLQCTFFLDGDVDFFNYYLSDWAKQ